ncbi:MAG: lysine--tRNA ligase, partial [Betaproteobacteria bacterium]|nr:lysine--tRNA ligase [Betaproteobacteria bacterium]
MTDQVHDENHLIAERREKLKALREHTPIPFPNNVRPSDRAQELLDRYQGESRESLDAKQILVHLAGRMMLKRVQGKASFASLQDASGRI